MIKKIALLLAIVMVISVCFVACDKKGGTDKPDDEKSDPSNPDSEGGNNEGADVGNVTLDDTSNDENDYYYNPKLEAAYRVDDTTVRFKISGGKVFCPTADLEKFVYASTSVFGSKVKAKSTKMLDPKVVGKDNPELCGMYFDVKFESAIPEDGYLCLEETVDTDNDGGLNSVLCDVDGVGVYGAYRPADHTLAPVAAIRYTNDVIEAPEMPTVLLRAYCEDPSQNIFIMEFSKPVTAVDYQPHVPGEWMTHLFICDSADPTPGKDGSWQNSCTGEPVPLDPKTGKDGLIYASKWEVFFSGTNCPEEGVLRLSENNSYADGKFPDEPDNDDLGRIVCDMDGNPLEGSYKSAYDVAHCKYSTKTRIPGGSYDIANQ